VIVSFLLVLNIASKKLTISDPMVLGLCGLWAGSSLLFLLVEAKYASQPIFPLRLLLHRDVLTAHLHHPLIVMGQMAVGNLPFRVWRSATDSETRDVFISTAVLSRHRGRIKRNLFSASLTVRSR
jgi:hypothetical protein